MKLYDLRTEYRKNPIGLDVAVPRFSWKIESEEKNTVQEKYRIEVTAGDKKVWDTQEVKSADSVLIPYGGEALTDETDYLVKVNVWDNHGKSDCAEMSFATGIFDPASFQAQMITHDFPADETACPVFGKEFSVRKPLQKAVVYATALGVYEMTLNGKRVGEDHMTPGWTSYHKRLLYQVYNITGQLNSGNGEEGDNRIEITVGNGWYKGMFGFDLRPDRYGDRTAAFAELHLTYKDGSTDVIATDDTWYVRTGEIRSSEIYMGETIDTTYVPGEASGKVRIMEFDRTILHAQENEPVRITQRIPAQKIFVTPKGEKVVDFGQNLAGAAEIRIHGTKGQKITVRHAETLDKDGNFYTENLRQARSEDTYICNGEEQVFFPHFTFHGFRYICVEGIEEKHMRPEMFTACVMHSDMEETGSFHTSNRKINQLQSNISWGMRGNFLDIPTDCPQRDERLGWTGDAQVFSWTASYLRNTALFFSKWMRDVSADSSLEKGVPHVVPDILGQYSSSAWSDAAVIVPWVVYQTYGDTRILEENWKCMHEWVDYITDHRESNGLWMSGFQYGDWLALDKEESADRTGATDKYLIANAYYLYVTDLVKQTAEVLGKKEEAEKYGELYGKTLEAFRREYYTPMGRIVSETQTGCVLSLYFNLARPEDRERILQTLVVNIENHKNHLATGFVGTPYLCHVLSENGAHGMASTLLMREDYPSWLYAVNMGATTIWERWNSIKPDGTFDESGMNSLNHYSYGSIGDWMYRKAAGISQLEPGYKKILIRPMLVKGLEEVHAKLQCPYGQIASGYVCRDGKLKIHAEIPANTTAVIVLPEKEEQIEAGSGVYEYEYDTATSLKRDRFTMESTFGEILSQPLAVQMFEQMVPGMMDNPMIKMAYEMTVSELAGMVPEAKPLYEAVIRALNEQEG
ncbi:alfa-L-rhamnosidase [Lachnoclostridium sp. An169]|uniref:alpha-L-rhamnosidase n=1 Tax=Lachnoclostridium sp. An169 TaxID=1965569 RepID=UPI000B37A54D|nr:alpha-L-rhamnosidase [Lachnoclostridium sp. An169]OUP85424.1 alfa-L-rhamnosidase [Lachnoclostridium sp. An169]